MRSPTRAVRVLWNDTSGSERASRRGVVDRANAAARHKVLALPAMLPTWRLPLSGHPEWMLVSSHLFAHHIRHARRRAKVRLRAHARPLHLGARARQSRQRALGAGGEQHPQAHRPTPSRRGDLDRGQQQLHRRARRPRLGAAVAGDVSRLSRPRALTTTRTGAPTSPTPSSAGSTRFPRPTSSGLRAWSDYKRLERVIQIGAEMRLPVVIAGTGPAEMELRSFAADRHADVTFIIGPSDP